MEPELESALEALLVRAVRRAGGMTDKIVPTRKGMPDRLVLLAGRVHLVELKTLTGRLSPAQRAWHAKASQRGVCVDVLYGRQAVLRWVDWASAPDRKEKP